MIGRKWFCSICGHENYGSFPRGKCENCERNQTQPGGLEPGTNPSPNELEYRLQQAYLRDLHEQRDRIDQKITETVNLINGLKRRETVRLTADRSPALDQNDRMWVLRKDDKEYRFTDYNWEITSFDPQLQEMFPNDFHYGGNAYWITGTFAANNGFQVLKLKWA